MSTTLILSEAAILLAGCGIVAVAVSRRITRGSISRKETGLAWIGASLAMSSVWTIGKPWLSDGEEGALLALNVVFVIFGAIYIFWPE